MENLYYIKYNLQFFEGGEKTEQPTARKKTKAREEGQVAKSTEVGTAFLFLAVFFGLRYLAPYIYNSLTEMVTFNLSRIDEFHMSFDDVFLAGFLNYMFIRTMLIALPIFAVTMVIGIVVNIVQVGWHPTSKPLKPKFSKLNPISGFKRMFSMRVLFDLIKSVAKFAVIAYAMYGVIMDQINHIPSLYSMNFFQAFIYIGDIIVDLGIRVGMWFLFIAAADYFYQRYKHNKELKMTKQEVKEEFKNIEGNPQIKGKIRQKMREASMRRMMQEVPTADVIITNPTHFAVAIKYDKEASQAPILVAKGVDYLAQKIKDKAIENKVEIVENKQVARAIYNTVDIGREIPVELYQAVAEILAFVYKLKNK